MLNKSLWLLPLLIASTLFLTGAWSISTAPFARNDEAAFVPKVISLPTALFRGEITAGHILEKALEQLSSERVSWMRMKIRQTMTDAQVTFVAEGVLQRGPKHCARLELAIEAKGTPSRLLVVSDGVTLATERRGSSESAVIECEALPTLAEGTSGNEQHLKEAHLTSKGCGGPLNVLQQLKPRLLHLKKQTGLLHGQPVIQLKGELGQEEGPSTLTPSGLAVRFASVFLDAKTLWPLRFEWWGGEKSQRLRSILCIEFRDPQLNQELSGEECVRLFSYQPNQPPAQ
jgi:hypothetical protein